MTIETEISPLTAERIRQYRQARDWTQQELADLAGLERKSIIRYEMGQNIPSGKALLVLTKLFGVSADYLLGLSDDPQPSLTPAELSPLELEAIQAFRRAGDDSTRQRLLETLNDLILPQ